MSRLRARLDGARRAAVLIQEIRPQLEELQRGLRLDVDDPDLPEIPEVEPDLEGLPSAPEPLFDSRNDWVAATRRLVSDRALAAEDAA
jgi:hypothetical protein